MKLLRLPVKLAYFWYPESLAFFFRTWRNLILYLEEDLAVGLMFKLLFVPLFHDSSLVGRLLSFFFRTFRILIGVFAFVLVTTLIFALAAGWFLTPVLAAVLPYPADLVFKAALFCGVVLFVHHILAHPAKKVWEVGDAKEAASCSLVKKKDLTLPKLLQSYQVKNLLSYLEKTPRHFGDLADLPVPQEDILGKALKLGRQVKSAYLGPEHFFVAKIFETAGISSYLMKQGLTTQDFVDALDFLRKKEAFWRVFWVWDEDFPLKHLKGVNRGWLGIPTPTLDSVSEDLTKKASREFMEDFNGRPQAVAQVTNILSLEKGRNVVVVAEPGSGRSALVDYLAKLIVSGDAPASLATKRIVKLDLGSLMAGITSQGDLADRIKAVFEEVRSCGDIVVFIDEIQNLGMGEAGSQFNLYSLLLPYIESSDFQFIATTEPGNYTRILERNGAFARLFTKVELPPATVSETVEILKIQAIEHERSKKVKTSLLAIKAIPGLCSRYIHDRVLPDSALSVFTQCLGSAEGGWVTKKVAEALIQARAGVPVGEVVESSKKQQLLNLEQIIHKTMVGQEQAVQAVAGALRRSAVQLRDVRRPIASFLFVGPTGVGKTELAKTLAAAYFQDKNVFLRFDMSEYQTGESVNRLIGGPGEEGLLTEEVRTRPYCLLLLDEFEKADPKLLTVFLQVLDDGRLTSGSGKVVDFTNTIIIATSNAASLTIARGLQSGMSWEQLDQQVSDELMQTFRPELINRFDDVILFKPLSPTDLQKIVRLKLAGLQKQLQSQGYLVEFADDLVGKLTEQGYDPVLGARPLARLIQDTIEARLSVLILEGKLPKGEKFTASEQLLAD